MKKKKKKSKVKRIFLLIIFIGIIALGCYGIKLNSSYFDGNERCLYVNNNVISFDCMQGYKYIHLKLSSNPEEHIKYNIINPKGKVVKSDVLNGNSEFFCNSEKGMWKVAFELNKEVNVNYDVWEGNLKFKDPLQE